MHSFATHSVDITAAAMHLKYNKHAQAGLPLIPHRPSHEQDAHAPPPRPLAFVASRGCSISERASDGGYVDAQDPLVHQEVCLKGQGWSRGASAPGGVSGDLRSALKPYGLASHMTLDAHAQS